VRIAARQRVNRELACRTLAQWRSEYCERRDKPDLPEHRRVGGAVAEGQEAEVQASAAASPGFATDGRLALAQQVGPLVLASMLTSVPSVLATVLTCICIALAMRTRSRRRKLSCTCCRCVLTWMQRSVRRPLALHPASNVNVAWSPVSLSPPHKAADRPSMMWLWFACVFCVRKAITICQARSQS
jgi:hypothetical protein